MSLCSTLYLSAKIRHVGQKTPSQKTETYVFLPYVVEVFKSYQALPCSEVQAQVDREAHGTDSPSPEVVNCYVFVFVPVVPFKSAIIPFFLALRQSRY